MAAVTRYLDGEQLYWSLPDCNVIHLETFGEQHLVFHSLSGETHLLPDFSAHVLRTLGDGACTAKQVAKSLCMEAGEACDDEFAEKVTQTLEQLKAVGLVGNPAREAS